MLFVVMNVKIKTQGDEDIMPRRIRDAKLRNGRPTRQNRLDRDEEEDEET